ncbi:hypothetical protein UFOVP242_57 [uncultured Caudovirales phage]|uniref:Collagen triple helix repeat n=1 Tax=uncultured Caudovirales phage TaxID=2100421 RepID=A0A6J7X396_9CAUD|nr:hypothetical protein UFOVP242_57 [uncultured Caudovirales phage]
MDKFSLKDLVKEEIETPAPKSKLWEPISVEVKEPIQEFTSKTSRIGSLSSLHEDLKESKTTVKSGWTPIVQKVEEKPREVFPSAKPASGFRALKDIFKEELTPTGIKPSVLYEKIEIPPLVEYKKTKEEERDELVQSFTEQIKVQEQDRSIEPARVEPIQEPEPVAEEAIVEPVTEEAPKEKTLIDKVSEFITKELKSEENSYQQPEVPPTAQNFKEVTRKVKFLEEWVSKISLAGPGGGAVNLKDLDDVDYNSVKNASNSQVLTFNSTSNLWVASNQTGGTGGGIALTDLSVTIDTPSGNGNLIYNNTTGVFTFTPAATIKGDTGDTGPAGPTGNTGARGPGVTVADTPPADPGLGDLWWDDINGQMYIYYINAWVVANSTGTVVPTLRATTLVTSATYSVTASDWYIGVNYAGPVTITLPTGAVGQELVIKDESGACATYPITLSGTVDNDAGGAVLQINNGGLHLLYRSGWRII